MKYILALCLGFVFISLGCKTTDDGMATPTLPKISVGSVTLTEGDVNRDFNFQLFLNEAYDKDVRVSFVTEDQTAEAGTDYVATSGTLTIPAGDRNAIITVEIIADTLREQDETFLLQLMDPENAVIQAGEGIGTIRNDDTYIFIPDEGYITPESYAGYNLVWQDEFSGPSLNTDDWTYEIGASGWGNNEWQYYTDREDNSYISDGALIIEAKEEAFSGANYTSARLITQNKQLFTFGRVDIRAILPEGQGIWPALWMLGTNISDIGWPACGEIDIMELVGHEPSTVHGTAHWGPQGQGYSHFTGGGHHLGGGEKFSDKYHVFSIIWEPNSIRWMVDDTEYFSITNADVNGGYPFNEDFFFIFNVAVGGNWPGYPDATTTFPQRMSVDYIRVFQEQ